MSSQQQCIRARLTEQQRSQLRIGACDLLVNNNVCMKRYQRYAALALQRLAQELALP